MAKEQFQRSKPHVNVAQERLRFAGMSQMGIQQLIARQTPTNPNDLKLAIKLAANAAMALPQVNWEVMVRFTDGEPA
jgi:hypothetical protein